jgi:hypothetical protein
VGHAPIAQMSVGKGKGASVALYARQGDRVAARTTWDAFTRTMFVGVGNCAMRNRMVLIIDIYMLRELRYRDLSLRREE